MYSTMFTRTTSSLTALMHMVFSVLLVAPTLVTAQTIDVEPPSIALELVEEGVRGETQVFSATVTDNNEIASISLRYRFGTAGSYETVPMSAIAGTSIYTASVDTADTAAGVIQYYMEARDAGSNRTVQGFAFDPFERTLVEANSNLVAEAAPAEDDVNESIIGSVSQPMSTQRKVIYGVLGLLVVGGLVSAAGGGSSGGSTPGTVDLTILVDKFQ